MEFKSIKDVAAAMDREIMIPEFTDRPVGIQEMTVGERVEEFAHRHGLEISSVADFVYRVAGIDGRICWSSGGHDEGFAWERG